MLAEIIIYPHWFWLIIGGVLLAFEMLGWSGYLLWSGIAAITVGIFTWLFPLSWAMQGVMFALLVVISALLWFRWMQNCTKHHTAPTTLNQRGSQLIGKHLTLQTALIEGTGYIKMGGSSWRVQADNDLPAGCEVTVVAIDGITLCIKRRIEPSLQP